MSPADVDSLGRVGFASSGDRSMFRGITNDITGDNPVFATTPENSPLALANGSLTRLIELAGLEPVEGTLDSNVGGFDLDWGVWVGDGQADLELQKYLNSSDTDPLAAVLLNPLVLSSALPTDIGALTGQKRYNVFDWQLVATGFESEPIYDVHSVSAHLYFDFDTGYFGFPGFADETPYLTICITEGCEGANLVEVLSRASQNVLGDGIFSQNISWHSGVSDGQGTFTFNQFANGQFLGNEGTGFLLNVDIGLYDMGESDHGEILTSILENPALLPGRSVYGAILFNGDPIQYVMTSVERDALPNQGFAILDGQGEENHPFLFGPASDASSGSDVQIADGTAFFESFRLVDQQAEFSHFMQPNENFDLHWGNWFGGESGTLLYDNSFDNTSGNEVLGETLFATFTPADIADLTASRRYDLTAYRLSESESESEIFASFDLDLANSVINNFEIEACVGSGLCATPDYRWITGELDGIPLQNFASQIHWHFNDGSLTGSETSETTFSGTISGSFLGDDAEGLVAGFDFAENGGDNNRLYGGLLFEQSPLVGVAEADTLTRAGFTIYPDPDLDGPLIIDGIIGSSSDGATGDPVIVENIDYWGDNSYPYNVEDDHRIARRLDAAVASLATDVGGYDLDWGFWETGETSNSGLTIDDDQFGVDSLSPLAGAWFASGTPTDISSYDGQYSFSATEHVQVKASGGELSAFSGLLEIDLYSGNFYGNLDICIGGEDCGNASQNWEVLIDYGVIDGPLLSGIPSGTVSFPGTESVDESIGGLFHGFFVGDTLSGLASGFSFRSFEEESDAALSGVALFELDPEPFEYSTDSFNGIGMALIPNWGNDIILGRSTFGLGEGEEGGPEVFSFSGDGELDEDLFNTDPDYIALADGFKTYSNTLPNHSVEWGIWVAGEGELHRRLLDVNNIHTFEENDGYFFSIETFPAELADLTGTTTFSSEAGGESAQFFGRVFHEGTTQSLTDFVGYFDVDFDSLAVSDGHLSLGFQGEGIHQQWLIDFGGLLTRHPDGATTAVVMDHSFIDINDFELYDDGVLVNDVTVEGSLAGIFAQGIETGPGFAGGFNLTLSGEGYSGTRAAGGFLLEEDGLLSGLEFQSLEQIGILATATSDLSDTQLFGGLGQKAGNSGNPILADIPFDPVADAFRKFPNAIFRKGEPTDVVDFDADVLDLGIAWGGWEDGGIQRVIRGPGATTTQLAQDAYWFVAPETPIANLTGTVNYEYVPASGGEDDLFIGTGDSGAITSIGSFGLELDFANGDSEGHLDLTVGAGEGNSWSIEFGREGHLLSTPGVMGFDLDTSTATYNESGLDTVKGELGGMVTGENGEAFVFAFALTGTVSEATPYVSGVLAASKADPPEEVAVDALSLPEPTVDEHNVDWGRWNKPVEENWVVVNHVDDNLATISTENHIAHVDPTPVANLQGSANYGSSLASGFIGSGNAGDVTSVLAGLDVDFNSGAISNGNLFIEVGGGDQNWAVGFDGTVIGGVVDLNAVDGSLSDPTGVISNSVEASLGGVFTGENAEAFVGGFDLVDQINQLNQVDGLYTIER
ncbi:MAG: hypothetical protein WD406_00800 [Pseudohongiellaceae bacterium]